MTLAWILGPWPAVLEQLADMFGASMTCLVTHDTTTLDGAMIAIREIRKPQIVALNTTRSEPCSHSVPEIVRPEPA
jgi:hypothetical protein